MEIDVEKFKRYAEIKTKIKELTQEAKEVAKEVITKTLVFRAKTNK